MNIIVMLLALAVIFVLVFVAIYIWAVKKHQFDDLKTPAYRIFYDDIPGTSKKDRK